MGDAVRELDNATTNIERLERILAASRIPRTQRRRWQSELDGWRHHQPRLARDVEALSGPELSRLDDVEEAIPGRLSALWDERREHEAWTDKHPEAAQRLHELTTQIEALDARLNPPPAAPEHAPGRNGAFPWLRRTHPAERDAGIDLGP